MDKRISAACERLSRPLTGLIFTFMSEAIVGGEIKYDWRVVIRDAQNKHTRVTVNAKRDGEGNAIKSR